MDKRGKIKEEKHMRTNRSWGCHNHVLVNSQLSWLITPGVIALLEDSGAILIQIQQIIS